MYIMKYIVNNKYDTLYIYVSTYYMLYIIYYLFYILYIRIISITNHILYIIFDNIYYIHCIYYILYFYFTGTHIVVPPSDTSGILGLSPI